MSEQPPDELTEFESEWIIELAAVLAKGFGSLRKKRNRAEVRSGVYRGALTALIPVYDSIAEAKPEGDLFDLGNEAAKQALWNTRVCPNQTKET